MPHSVAAPELRLRQTVSVRDCSRCGLDHEHLDLKKMARPHSPPEAGGLARTHWAACPASGDPVLVMVYDEPGGGAVPPGGVAVPGLIEQLRDALRELLRDHGGNTYRARYLQLRALAGDPVEEG
jgi:hypothetical protein